MRKLFKERKLFKGGNYMRKYGTWSEHNERDFKNGMRLHKRIDSNCGILGAHATQCK